MSGLHRRVSVDMDKKELDQELDHILSDAPNGSGPRASVTVTREEEEALLLEAEQDGHALQDPRQPSVAAGSSRSNAQGRLIIPAYIMIPVWISLSGGVILMNKHIFTNMDFPYPVFITAYHMIIATIGTQILRLIPGRLSETKVDVPWPVYARTIVPLALLFSASLILSNVAYVHLSVSFVQMLKAWIPILVLVIQLIIGAQRYNHLLLFIIAITSFGCSIAAAGELKFSVFGFSCQVGAVVVESCRLVLIQILLKEYSMSPLQSVALYAPLCAASIGALVPLMEGLSPFQHLSNVGPLMLIANGLVAFSLNIAGVFLIDSAGSLVLTLSGIAKDILLIGCAVLFMAASITGNQLIGYSIAILGLTLFRVTGGDPTSHYGKMIAGPAQLLFPVQAPGTVSSPGGRGSNGKSSWRRIFAVSGAAVALLGIISHLGIQHLVAPAYSHGVDTAVLRSVRYPSPVDEIQELGHDKWRGHFAEFVQNGLGRDLVPLYDATVDVHKLPRLAWVVVATPDAIERYAQELTAISCYCERAGIPFFIEHSLIVENRNFMTARHRSVARHLRYHQWVFATDADMLIVNSKRDPHEFLDDAVDVIFNDRDNREVCACAYFVRNSPGGWSFLRRWISWGDYETHWNRDNGDLNEIVAAGVRKGIPNNADYTGRYEPDDQPPASDTPEGETPCLNNDGNWQLYSDNFIHCLDQTFYEERYGDDTKPYWDRLLWDWTDVLPPVLFRSFKVFCGFVRPLEGNTHPTWFPYHTTGVPTDFLGTGKDLFVYLTPASLWCTGEEWTYPSDQFDWEETRVQMANHKYWWWQGCYDGSGVNLCKQIAAGPVEPV